jgi:ABC-type Fe3+-citrate transport system substrate-binding protein
MRVAAALAVAACLLMAGCGDKDQDTTTGHTGCPIPIHYDKATHDKIQAALDKLPPDSVLRQAMTDYEQERDDLRFCR